MESGSLEFHIIRCPNKTCNKFLFRVCGMAYVEVICPRCKAKIMWPDPRQVSALQAVVLPIPLPAPSAILVEKKA